MAHTLTPLTVSLTLDQATSIIDAALAAARKNELLPLTVAVLDELGVEKGSAMIGRDCLK